MKRRPGTWPLLLFFFTTWTPPGQAVIGTIDPVPAATLLLPHFEVDLKNPDGQNTVFTIGNADSLPALAHVTLWTNAGVPSRNFDVYLGGYDTQKIDLRDIFVNGLLPQTSSSLANQGKLSGPNVDFPGCSKLLPPANYSAVQIQTLQEIHTGKQVSTQGNCWGIDLGDDVARGYVTVDSVSQCSLASPQDPGYFVSGGFGISNNDNILWGDSIHFDANNGFAQGESLVHIEADANDPLTSTADRYTFYGRYVSGQASDNREGLPSQVALPFESNRTQLHYWRDLGVPDHPFACDSSPPWFPANQTFILVFDWLGSLFEPGTTPPFCAEDGLGGCFSVLPFPQLTGRTAVNGQFNDIGLVSVPLKSGAIFLDLSTSFFGASFNPEKQTWVTVLDLGENIGLSSTSINAVQLNNVGTINQRNPEGPSDARRERP